MDQSLRTKKGGGKYVIQKVGERATCVTLRFKHAADFVLKVGCGFGASLFFATCGKQYGREDPQGKIPRFRPDL